MADPEGFAKDVIADTVSETAGKVLDAEIARNLAGPAASEIGQLLGDITGMVRFYATENMKNICTRWSEARKNKPLSGEEARRVMPLLQTAAMVSDEELQERWARLLQSVAVGLPGVLPSFGQTLSQLTPEEARYLDELWKRGSSGHKWKSSETSLRFDYEAVMLGPESLVVTVELQRRANELHSEFAIVLSDLLRMGILEAGMKTPSQSVGLRNHDAAAMLSQAFNDIYEKEFSFSTYGRRFMAAISEPK